MKKVKVTLQKIKNYESFMIEEEKSKATIEKYIRDITQFYDFLPNDKLLTVESTIAFKKYLLEHYKLSSVNSILAAINGLCIFLHVPSCKVKRIRIQKKLMKDKNRELTKHDYQRLLSAAAQNEKLHLLIQTICASGIRVSEIQFITVEAVRSGSAVIYNKGKMREILISKLVRKKLLTYCKKQNIQQGAIFITRNGKPMDRSNIWKMMKALCEIANVDKNKVFPHNLRHLFALTFYRIEKDLVRLADILGHTSIETTRGYTRTARFPYERVFQKMGLAIPIP